MKRRHSSVSLFCVVMALVLLANIAARSTPATAQTEPSAKVYLPSVSIPTPPVVQPLMPAELGEPLPIEGDSPFFADSAFDASGDLAIWIPPNAETVRGIYLHNIAPIRANPKDPEWRTRVAQQRELASRQLASMWGFAYMSGMLWDEERRSFDAQEALLHQALDEFAAMTGHDELRYAPLAIRGESRTGAFGARYAAKYPERVVAYTIVVAGSPLVAPGVPGLILVGERDKGDNVVTGNFLRDRNAGGLLAVAMMWRIDHKCDRCNDLSWPFLDQMVQTRVPADADLSSGPVALEPLPEEGGWLGNVETWDTISAYDAYPGDQRSAAWLPSREFAYLWWSFVQREPLGTMAQPTHPYKWSKGFSQEPAPLEGGKDQTHRAGRPLKLVAKFDTPVSGEVQFYDGDRALGIATLLEDGTRAELDGVILDAGMHSLFAMEDGRPITRPAGIILLPPEDS